MNGTGSVNNSSLSISQPLVIDTAGTITIGSAIIRKSFKYTAGSITSASNGAFNVYPPATFDIANIPTRIPVRWLATGTITLASNLVCSEFGKISTTQYATMAVAGDYDIDCDDFTIIGNSDTLSLNAGQTITVNNGIYIPEMIAGTYLGATIKSDSVGNKVYLNYGGTMANCHIFNASLTDIDASGSSIPIYNWMGEVSDCTNIKAVTGADIGGAGLTLTII